MVFDKKQNKPFRQNANDNVGLIEETASDSRLQQSLENDAIDAKFGFTRLKDVQEKTGWLLNMHATETLDEDKRLRSAVDYYFIQENGSRFKVSHPFQPYFYIICKTEVRQDTVTFLGKKYAGYISGIKIIQKEDLDLENHLTGLKQTLIKLSFVTINDFNKVRQPLLAAVRRNKEAAKTVSGYGNLIKNREIERRSQDHFLNLLDIREHDVPYHVRVSIDLKIFVGKWYDVKAGGLRTPVITVRDDILVWPDCIVLAYDIETTKLPLKFPDAATDQIMMISYMIDGLGYLITNREIVSEDVDDFEYNPKPEFEGCFTIFNEPDEMSVIQRFFDHILEVKPHIFVTYNGDFFDWPFVEARAGFHGIDMLKEVGFSKSSSGCYLSRPSMHMDCLCWVKRDSYLPVGSQNLKAVAKAKLRYDPVELDPEEMCPLAASQPQVLANYSVSDAVATYYLYMKYVHPFIFALCTIIPMEPDEILRKGSGTLCEALLMVQAFHSNIVYPNKQETVYNKLTEQGNVLDQETYVGGHVEAIESGVFRADIPCRFRLVPEALQKLIDDVDRTIKFTIEEEEKVLLSDVENYEEIVWEIKSKLEDLRDTPCRLENPLIYHLDVGAMYPNIILTNRLQPSAMVDETICASCDFNKPGATCQRKMTWMWRGELMPASRSEYHRIQQQLEMERFPPYFPGGPHRAFHQLSKEDQAAAEKTRLQEYCRKVYKKIRVTKTEEREQIVCQREHNFYVNTVLSFRDRRYDYKALLKLAKKEVAEAQAKGDSLDIKAANSKAVLYDSLQLAHKCILNSFYGYVMRRGSRWHSMEMAGIVCYTGANIITRSREIVEQIGRPLELDTDGIWCILPASFPENFVIKTRNPKKSKITISYPGSILNLLVKDQYTNDQYHDLVSEGSLNYSVRSENSIFFEVDGPYLAMILPASKEEGKKLKKRYAVFNFDGSLAELKGFEVKRRGELQLVKIFQSSVFEAFLKGDSLETCYASVAKIADYWLDVLYSKASNMPDSELFDLISEKKSMSKKLEEYGAQKSTSISTAKRLAEFLGDQMVKDAGLSCKFIISKKPDGAPVTERAIPLAIFQSEPSVKHYYLKRWLKDHSITNFDIRNILDWDYYRERLSGTIQKIITIPAALQGISNPVPRVQHPDWLHKRVLERTDTLKQRRITDMFSAAPKNFENVKVTSDNNNSNKSQQNSNNSESPVQSNENNDSPDIEDMFNGISIRNSSGGPTPRVSKVTSKRKRAETSAEEQYRDQIHRSWREVLGNPPKMGITKDSMLEWIKFHKRKWEFQRCQRENKIKRLRCSDYVTSEAKEASTSSTSRKSTVRANTIGGFLRKAQRTLLDLPWQIVQIVETGTPGNFKVWCLVENDLHCIKLTVPRIFYVNQRSPKEETESNGIWRLVNKTLPRSHPCLYLYEYTVPEEIFQQHSNELMADLSTPDIEGIYETQVSLQFRSIVQLGCLCTVDNQSNKEGDQFELKDLRFATVAQYPYLKAGNALSYNYLYHHKSGGKSIIGIFLPNSKKAFIYAVDSVKSNQMPNLKTLYNNERTSKLNKDPDSVLPPEGFNFDINFEVDVKQAYRQVLRVLQNNKEEKRGPSYLAVQSIYDFPTLYSVAPGFIDFPLVPIQVSDVDSLYSVLDWQRVGAKTMIRHFLSVRFMLERTIELARYLHVPIGNLPRDTASFGADVFFARHLQKHNTILWCSNTPNPDLGGHEDDDNRLIAELEESSLVSEINNSKAYSSVCVELDIDALAVNTILQASHINELEGTSNSTAFDSVQQTSVDSMLGKTESSLTAYDETARSAHAFKVVRQMVASWLREISLYQNVFADFQIVHFYRWLRDPMSLLYDPALGKILQTLMQKVFFYLISEFKRLGSIIVFGNFTKIVISTKKKTVEDALSYTKYIIENIRNKELFHSIDIKSKQCWKYLMWLDLSNHGGIKGEIDQNNQSKHQIETEDSENLDRTIDSEILDQNEELVIEMNWNISDYLSEWCGCQSNFNSVIASYINSVYENNIKVAQNFTQGHTPIRKRLQSTQVTPTQPDKITKKFNSSILSDTLDLEPQDERVTFAEKLVAGELSQKLFFITQQIFKKESSKNFSQVLEEEERDNVHLMLSSSKSSPALQFVKSICKVLSLDQEVQPQVNKLRRNLLKLLGIGEFSPEGKWSDPCVSFVLSEVICKSCNHCRDIDLCKDPNQRVENDRRVWFCVSCECTYDIDEIEQMLISVLQTRSMAYVLQDLVCDRCSMIKQQNIKSFCTCGGNYKNLLNKTEFCDRIKVFLVISKIYQLQQLQEYTEWIIQRNPWIKI